MKRLISGSLSFFLLTSMSAAVVSAQMPSEKPSNRPAQTTPSTNESADPFSLVGLAYQGALEDQGIPSAENLLIDYRGGAITPSDLVKAGIQANRVSPNALDDPGYMAAVESQLNALSNRSRP